VHMFFQLAHGLDLTVTAEAVETAAQAGCLREFGADTAQGWHYGRPTTLDAIAARPWPAAEPPAARQRAAGQRAAGPPAAEPTAGPPAAGPSAAG
jgi:predicted signal transduction protein with EAL and GGDEF domain